MITQLVFAGALLATPATDSGDDTAAMILVIDSSAPNLCELVNHQIVMGEDPAEVVEHGTESFAVAFNPSDDVVAHMHLTLTICAYGF